MRVRHPLHRQNGNGLAQIAVAVTMIAFEDIDQERDWRHQADPSQDYISVPMARWAAILDAAKRAARMAREMPDVATAFCTAITAVKQADHWNTRAREIQLPITLWADLLGAHDKLVNDAWVVKAYATEHHIKFGRFPGR